MKPESLEALSQQMLQRWRRRREAPPAQAAGSATAAGNAVQLMIVQQVVPADAERGPHLLATPVRFDGIPPAPQPASNLAVRCYPLPSRPVTEYQPGELIKVFCAAGANVTEKIV